MPLTRLKLERFTAFEKLDLKLSPGINVLVGANGTGKTHLMKVAYAACDISKPRTSAQPVRRTEFAEKLVRVFLPSGWALGRLAKRQSGGSSEGKIAVYRNDNVLRLRFIHLVTDPSMAKATGVKKFTAEAVKSVYIPVKEMLANAPGFRSHYAQREVHFEEIYDDILTRAYQAPPRGPVPHDRKELLDILGNAITGKVVETRQEFFLRNKQGNLEFTLLAEGMRKLGLLWLLIRNGALQPDSVLFWDEPETNLNPKLYRPLIEILLKLQRSGVQIFIATHDYAILKGIDLGRQKGDQILFHSMYRDEAGDGIACNSTDRYVMMQPNTIADAIDELYDRQIKRSLVGL